MTDALLWHRIQFAFTITFHYLFPQLTMCLALLIVVFKSLALSVMTGDARAAAALRTVAAVLVVLNLIPSGFVFLEIRETLTRIYSDQQIYRALVLTLVGGTLVPVVLLLVGDGAPSRLGAVLLIMLGGFAVRSLFLKIPHASHESRSRDRA